MMHVVKTEDLLFLYYASKIKARISQNTRVFKLWNGTTPFLSVIMVTYQKNKQQQLFIIVVWILVIWKGGLNNVTLVCISVQGQISLCLKITSRCLLLVWPHNSFFLPFFPELDEDIDRYPWMVLSPVVCVCVCVHSVFSFIWTTFKLAVLLLAPSSDLEKHSSESEATNLS